MTVISEGSSDYHCSSGLYGGEKKTCAVVLDVHMWVATNQS